MLRVSLVTTLLGRGRCARASRPLLGASVQLHATSRVMKFNSMYTFKQMMILKLIVIIMIDDM